MSSNNRYTYTAYGLNFASALPLPELLPAVAESPDVTIGYGDVPVSLPDACENGVAWQSAPGQLLLSVVGVARYLLIENREIRIQPLPGSADVDVRTFLLGSVLGAMLHARRMLVLHASVIQTDAGAVLFMGRSGAGKSTLLGAFLQRGYLMMSDDKAGITLDERGVPYVMPGLPFIRLTHEAATALRYPVDENQLRHRLDKYAVPVERFHSTAVVLRAAYALNAHNRSDIRLEELQTLERFNLLNRHVYRRRFVQKGPGRQTHFEILGAVSNRARVVRVFRPEYPRLIDELRARIEDDLAAARPDNRAKHSSYH
jgi:hypothetical protein